MAMKPTRAPLPGRRRARAAFDAFVGLEPAPLDVLVARELVAVVVGRGVGDDVELVGAALVEMLILLPILEYVVQDDVAGAG